MLAAVHVYSPVCRPVCRRVCGHVYQACLRHARRRALYRVRDHHRTAFCRIHVRDHMPLCPRHLHLYPHHVPPIVNRSRTVLVHVALDGALGVNDGVAHNSNGAPLWFEVAARRGASSSLVVRPEPRR